MKPKFRALGNKVTKFDALETFSAPQHVGNVTCVSDEVTANCPVTGQPDWYIVTISYIPDGLCVESKSLKLYLQSFRNAGLFCEQFAEKVATDIWHATEARRVLVEVNQKPRGGISIRASATVGG